MLVRKPRKPSEKFVPRKNSTARKFNPTFLHPRFRSIFSAAESIFRMPREENSRIIFIGTGMRPLFEAVRGLNEQTSQFPRKDFRYLITPPAQLISRESIPSIQLIRRELEKRGMVTPGKTTYYVVDRSFIGRTFNAVSTAIQMIAPNAYIRQIDNEIEGPIGSGISQSDQIGRPASKKMVGNNTRLERSNSDRDAIEYLRYQRALRRWLHSKQNPA